MYKPLALLLIGLFFGTGFGFLIAASSGSKLEGHAHNAAQEDHSQHSTGETGAHDHSAHDHSGDMIDLPAGSGAPSIKIAVTPDPVSGWNLHVKTENFRFAPNAASAPNAPGEGHAHLYANGEKLARIYGDWFHIAHLPKGAVEVSVSLNANDHTPLSIDGTPLRAKVTVQVP